jgi:hypothetical protein
MHSWALRKRLFRGILQDVYIPAATGFACHPLPEKNGPGAEKGIPILPWPSESGPADTSACAPGARTVVRS